MSRTFTQKIKLYGVCLLPYQLYLQKKKMWYIVPSDDVASQHSVLLIFNVDELYKLILVLTFGAKRINKKIKEKEKKKRHDKITW